MNRSLVILLAMLCFMPRGSVAGDLYEERLNRGIRNTDPYAFLLISSSRSEKERADSLLHEARKYAPDLPATYFEIAKRTLSLSPASLFEAVDYTIQGIAAYGRNFWWSFMMAASVFVAAILSFFASLIVLFGLRLPQDLPLLAHDMAEKRAKAILLLILVIGFFGPLFLFAGILTLISFYQKKRDRLLLATYIALLLVSPWVCKTASTFLYAPVSGPLKAIVAVNESRDNSAALSLRTGQTTAEQFSYGLALKREGEYGEARGVYERLIRMAPDARTYNNLANIYVALNDFDRAKELYLKSRDYGPLPSTLYNLSQVYRETLDFEKGEEWFLAAQKMDPSAVSRYRSVYSRHPNRFVIDETLSQGELSAYARSRTKKFLTAGFFFVPPVTAPFIGLVLAAAVFFLSKYFTPWAYRCSRCGKILCSKCEKRLLWGQMCGQCYGSLVKLDEFDAKERIARLLAVYEHQRRRRWRMKLIALLLPGGGLIYGGDLLYGFSFLWIFLFACLLPLLNSFFSVGMYHFTHVWLNVGAVALAIVLYVISNVVTRRRLAKGWL